MNCEVVAVGTELLLGPSVDTNSTWIGERLAENGIDSFFHTVVGDNRARIGEALRVALARSDAVIVTGGLGPTQDDITRDALADVMGVPLVFDAGQEALIAAMFAARNRTMAASNRRQAWRPEGSTFIENRRGTAPGVAASVDGKPVYLLPGVPYEMKEMMTGTVLPELRTSAGAPAVILSRYVRTWGVAEATLAELVAPRFEVLDAGGASATIAFLVHGIDGIHIRVTAKAQTAEAANAVLDAEEAEIRALLGPLVIGTDDETMEVAVARLLLDRGATLGLAESLTGGLVASRLTAVPGASAWLRGALVSYANEVKHRLLEVPDGPVVSGSAAVAMAEGARRVFGSDIGLGLTGVAGPAEQDGQPVGTVFAAIALFSRPAEVIPFRLSGDRQRIRELACINVLDALRRRLLGVDGA